MTKRPDRIDLGAHAVTIIADELVADRGANGETYRERLEVRIGDGMAATVEREVVVHELLHVAWHATNLRTEEHAAHAVEEEVVTALAPLVLELLRRNPRLVEWLTG